MTDTERKALELVLEWREGPPPKPWSEEWFIALTTYGDRVVLRSLPEEYTYDFTTADSTYLRADKIAKWMQFPDSQYIAPYARAHELDKASHAAEMREQAERFSEAAANVCGVFAGLIHADSAGGIALAKLRPFILAPVDPLARVIMLCNEDCSETWAREMADRLRTHGVTLAIVKKEAVNG